LHHLCCNHAQLAESERIISQVLNIVALHQSLLQRCSGSENLKASASTQQRSIAPIFAAKMQQQLAQSQSINQWEQCEYCSIFAHHMLWSATA
jgi:hypothetical protein